MIYLGLIAVVLLAAAVGIAALSKKASHSNRPQLKYYLFACRLRGVGKSNESIHIRCRILVAENSYSQAEGIARNSVLEFMERQSSEVKGKFEEKWTAGRTIDRKSAKEENIAVVRLLDKLINSSQNVILDAERTADSSSQTSYKEAENA
jgi:hypothetical protein